MPLTGPVVSTPRDPASNISDRTFSTESHDLDPCLYADDTQGYGWCQPLQCSQLVHHLSDCLADVAAWMRSNRSQLNPAKMEVIWCASSRRQYQILQTPLTVGSDPVVPVRVVWDLPGLISHVVKTARQVALRCCGRSVASDGLCQD